MQTNPAPKDYVFPEDYLAGEEVATEKHEYLNGFVYPYNMAGAGDAHVKISLNAAALRSCLEIPPDGANVALLRSGSRIMTQKSAVNVTPAT
jgi:hypothetical protein